MRTIFKLLLAIALLSPVWARAQINETILTMAITNYTGYVIASDVLFTNAGYNREDILANSRIESTNSGGLVVNTYYLSYRLLDTNNQPQPIYDSAGLSNITYNITNSFLMGAGSTIRTNVAPIRPFTRLDHFNKYTVELRLFRTNVFTGDIATDGPRTYYHFTNLVSGDVDLNIIATNGSAGFSQMYAVQTIPNKKYFQANVNFTLRRYDDFSGLNFSDNIPLTINYELRDNTNGLIPLVNNQTNFIVNNVADYAIASPIAPVVSNLTQVIRLEPTVQLDSVNKSYRVIATLSYTNQPLVPSNTRTSALTALLHFNGRLLFGPASSAITTTFSSIANTPFPMGFFPPTHVLSQLNVDANSGVVVGKPFHTYGSGAPLSVHLLPNGDARSQTTVTLNAPIPDDDNVSKIRFIRLGPTTLGTFGAQSNIRVILPTGLGYRLNNTSSRILTATIDFNAVPLDQSLIPNTDLTYAPGFPIFACEESKPVWIEASSIFWKIATGEFTINPVGTSLSYVRRDEYAYLESVMPLLIPPTGIKRSNEKYFRFLDRLTTPIVSVKPDSQGNARASFDIAFFPGSFLTHFPYNSFVQWTGAGGNMNIVDDLVVPTSTPLDGMDPVQVNYARTCDGCGGAAPPDNPTLKPAGNLLNFTRDGGLVAAGDINPVKELQWGYIPTLNKFAQRVTSPLFSAGNFHMPGGFMRGDQVKLHPFHRASALLYTGVDPSDPSYFERPDLPNTPNQLAYRDGFADYAGLNFRVGTNGAHQGHSYLAGQATGLYPLTGRSKYYVRPGGVSGIHEAVFGSFPTNAMLLGYEVNFSNYGLSYLDSLNYESRTEGSIKIPLPSNFIQPFEELKFTCPGGLDYAKVPSTDTNKVLEYWKGDFKTLAIDFKSNPGDACDPSKGSLVLGVEAWAAHIEQPLFGLLGFQTNGNLIPKNFGLEGIDSRLKLPNVIYIQGPAEEKYAFNPVADAYYNNYANHPVPLDGFMNLAGTLDVTFFTDLQVHIHTSADKEGTNAPIYMMGGWPSHGWEIAGQNFFNAAYFDDSNRGFPSTGGITPADYRDYDTQQYHVRAQKTWLGVVEFDYPLDWSSSLRSFKSSEPVTTNIVVLSIEHQCKYLSAENAELTFGIQYDGLPQINIASIAFNAIDEATGVAHAMADAATSIVRDTLEEGLDRLNRMLCDQMDKFFDDVLKATLDPVIDNLYTELQTRYNALPDPHTFPTVANSVLDGWIRGVGVDAVSNNFSNKLANIIGATTNVTGVLKQVNGYLGEVEDAIDAIIGTVSKDPLTGSNLVSSLPGLLKLEGGERNIAKNLVNELVGELASQFVSSIVEPGLSDAMAEIEPTLQQVTSVLGDIKSQISNVRQRLGAAGDFAAELQAKVASLSGEIGNVSSYIKNDVQSFFDSVDYDIDSPFEEYTAAEVKDLIRQKLKDRFFGSTVSSGIQTILKERIYDLDAALREGIDSAFQQLNEVIKSLISQTLQQLDTSINGFLGDLSDIMGAGQINGYAHINNDSLKLLRIDGHFQWKIPDNMEFNAYLQIKELDSDGPAGCTVPGGPTTEVSIGATDVDLEWISPGLRANVGAKFSFQTTPSFKPVGMGGSFEMTGALKFEAFEINQMAAAVSFGLTENYVSAALRMKFQQYELAGGIFFGRTCTLEPLQLWAPDVAEVLGTPPFTGAYVYGEGWIPISEALGIPATCLFYISAGVGAGAGYFIEGPTYVGAMMAGVSGEALCVVGIRGEVKMIGVKQGGDFRFSGTGKLSGKVGWCPFCIKFSKSVKIKYQNNSWDVDF